MRSALAALLALALAAPSLAAKPPGGDSPQAVVERLRAATAAGDLGEVVACMTPKARLAMSAGLFAGVAMMVAFSQMGEELGATLAEGEAEADAAKQASDAAAMAAFKNGFKELLRKHDLGELEGDAVSLEGDELERRFAALDHGAFVTDVMALMASMPGEHSSSSDKDLFPAGELRNLVVDADRATATLGGEPVRFQRIDGRWYVEEPVDEATDPAGES